MDVGKVFFRCYCNSHHSKKLKYLFLHFSSSFHRMKSCVLEHAERQPKYCDSKSIEYFDQYISNMAGNTLQLMCSDYDGDSDRCQRINRLSYDISKIIVPKSILKAFGNLLLLSSDFQTV